MFPGSDTEHEIGVGDFFGIYFLAGFLGDASSTIASCFGYGSLIDLAHRRQYDVVLMIVYRILERAVGVLAEVYLFEYVAVVEVIDLDRCSHAWFSLESVFIVVKS